MGLFAAVPSSLRLFDKLRRPSASKPSIPRDTVYVCPGSRPPHLASFVYSRMEIFGACRDLDFCRGYSLVVSTKPSRGSCIRQIRPPKLVACLITGLSEKLDRVWFPCRLVGPFQCWKFSPIRPSFAGAPDEESWRSSRPCGPLPVLEQTRELRWQESQRRQAEASWLAAKLRASVPCGRAP
jgi:hypothetical protein